MQNPIELQFKSADIVQSWEGISAESISTQKNRPKDQCYIFVPTKVNEKTISYLLNPYKNPDENLKNTNQYTCYQISSDIYDDLCKKKKIKPIFNTSDEDVLLGISIESCWQTLCGAAARFINVDASHGLEDILNNPANPWNIGTQLGYPIVLGIIGGIMHGANAYRKFEADGRQPNAEEWNNLVQDCAAYAAKSAISMGSWQLGYFVGQTVISILHISPFTLWAPVTLCICAGLIQAIFAVVNQIWDEKRKYGEVRSSTFDLVKLFLTTFIGGALWQACSYIPFVPLLAQHILKPLAEILGNILLGLATFIVLFAVNYLVPKAAEGLASITTFFSSPENKTLNNQDDKITTHDSYAEAIQKTITSTPKS